MDTDQWRKKREALLGQLRDLEAGRISHWDEGGSGELNRQRLADLDARFQDEADA
jgi:hypothetical protein